MKYLVLLLSVVLSLNGFAQQKELTWHTDVNKAINLSLKNDKPLLFSLLEVIGVDGASDYKKLFFFKT